MVRYLPVTHLQQHPLGYNLAPTQSVSVLSTGVTEKVNGPKLHLALMKFTGTGYFSTKNNTLKA